MSNQIVLSWSVSVANTPYAPTQAATALGAVPLYVDATTDPVLGQLFGLTVASDVTTNDATSATRTLTLNMTSVPGSPTAPPPFPCHPRTSSPPTLPYPLRKSVTLSGSFFVSNGSATVKTSLNMQQTLAMNDIVQFLSQEGVFYKVLAVGTTTITLTAVYTGVTGSTGAFREIPAPVTNAAVYSSSPLDTNGAATNPAIAAGPGARTLTIAYKDSTGSAFTTTVSLTGKRPAQVPLAGGSVDIAEIDNISVATTGSFKNSVGQITLVELTDTLPIIPSNKTPADFPALTDAAQLLIGTTLAYLPPSYFALSQQPASTPQLAGDFILTTGSKHVPTTEDQTSALASGNVIQFAEQLANYTAFGTVDVFYVVDTVAPTYITLTTPFTGVGNNNTGTNQAGTNSNAGTKGNLSAGVQSKASGAYLVSPSPAAPPTNTQLSGPLAQFVQTDTAAPPPNPPLDPTTATVPTYLSGLFTQTLQLALSAPISPQAITFA